VGHVRTPASRHDPVVDDPQAFTRTRRFNLSSEGTAAADDPPPF
jgi:hypothetical protein